MACVRLCFRHANLQLLTQCVGAFQRRNASNMVEVCFTAWRSIAMSTLRRKRLILASHIRWTLKRRQGWSPFLAPTR